MSFTDPSQRIVLGRCSVAQPNHCRFEPVLLCTEGGWEPVSDSNSMFPDSGKVFGIEHAVFITAWAAIGLSRPRRIRDTKPDVGVINCSPER